MKNASNNIEIERLKELERKQKERYKKQNEHTNKLYDRISFTVPKGRKNDIEKRAKQINKSINAYISDLVLNDVDNAQN